MFKVNPKSVYTNRDEGFDGNSVCASQKRCFHSQEYLKKSKKMVSASRNNAPF